MTPTRHGSTIIQLPNDLEVLIVREFDAPIALVFDVLTKPEHVRRWFSEPGDELTACSIDLRVGGEYHYAFTTADGAKCSFWGTYLEVEPPHRTVETWTFDGRPDGEAVESMDLEEVDGVTTVTIKMTFTENEHRPTRFEGMQESFDRVDEVVQSLVDAR